MDRYLEYEEWNFDQVTFIQSLDILRIGELIYLFINTIYKCEFNDFNSLLI
jgi:hypothetical protein